MATQHAVASFRMKDDAGVIKAFEEYVSYDDATATLVSIAAAMSAIAALLDPITDCQILSMNLRLVYDLPLGLKAAPVANSDVEETSLYTWLTDLPQARAYGQDIPAVPPAFLVGKNINQAQADVINWKNMMISAVGTLRHMDSRFAGHFTALKSAQKTFRKSRRALKRA